MLVKEAKGRWLIRLYIDVIMTTMTSQITSLTVVYSRFIQTQIKENIKLRVTGLCVGTSPGPVNSPHKRPVTRKIFPFDDVIMNKWTTNFDGVMQNYSTSDFYRKNQESRTYKYTFMIKPHLPGTNVLTKHIWKRKWVSGSKRSG